MKKHLPFLLFLALPLWAVDPPHWTSANTQEDCTTTCHALHTSLGSPLINATSNVNLCQSCHNTAGSASALPINTSDMASPGSSGFHHGFDVSATNANYGATPPTDPEMAPRVMGGNIVCSTCHNQHKADQTKGGNWRISSANKIADLGGTGLATSGGNYTGATGFWYLVEIDQAGSQATATFRWSKDNGLTWMATGVSCGDGVPVLLDNGVTVTFTGAGGGAFLVGERWQFYASWPFLRATLDDGDNATGTYFCRDCHTSWTMDHTSVESYDGNPKSHPVGIVMGANGRGYDRAVPLDGNGNPQGGAGEDGIKSNNLILDSGGRLQCLTCHNVHYADSNTLSEDNP